jgi:hypothetical protein
MLNEFDIRGCHTSRRLLRASGALRGQESAPPNEMSAVCAPEAQLRLATAVNLFL